MFNEKPLKKIKALLLFILIVSISAFKNQQPQVYQITTGKISFRSDAPLEIIKAASNNLIGLLDVSKNNFSFRIDVHSFQGFNSPLQKEHFNENYMESAKYPEASFKGKIIEDVDLTQDGNYDVRTKGILTIHNVPQERIIKSTVMVKQKIITVHSEFTVLLSDHNIPIPMVVNQKLANEIRVNVDATLESK